MILVTSISLDDDDEAQSILDRLHATGLLRSDQVNLLLTRWQGLDENDFAHPTLRGLGEHTQAMLTRLASPP